MKKSLFVYYILLSNFYFSQSLNGTKNNLLTDNSVFIYLGIFLGLTSLAGWYIWKRNRTIFEKYQPDNTLEEPRKQESKQEEPNETAENSDKNYYISNETVGMILKKLAKFERDHKYLKKDITLTWVANHLGTNTKYLSETIKMHRGKNFNNYINGLRINYITYMLYKNPEYREYKVVSLAKECGYSSSQVFVIAFKKENGIPPSYFIANLKNETTEAKVSLQ